MSKGRLIHFHACKGRKLSYKIKAVVVGLSSRNRIAWDGLSAYRMAQAQLEQRVNDSPRARTGGQPCESLCRAVRYRKVADFIIR